MSAYTGGIGGAFQRFLISWSASASKSAPRRVPSGHADTSAGDLPGMEHADDLVNFALSGCSTAARERRKRRVQLWIIDGPQPRRRREFWQRSYACW
jgi:hypothetical protein